MTFIFILIMLGHSKGTNPFFKVAFEEKEGKSFSDYSVYVFILLTLYGSLQNKSRHHKMNTAQKREAGSHVINKNVMPPAKVSF